MRSIKLRTIKILTNYATVIIGLVVIATCCVVALVLVAQNRDENDARFSRQLMAEYHATSSNYFSGMDADFHRFNGSTTVLTKDGKDTPVFVKLVSRDGNKVTMSFSAVGGNSLYPKSSE
jgi:hypothetical protein